ncbi:MAG: vitamin B12-dependent ribonucleotide reductase [Planctomycetia bacterium]|nr:vitamin B12-dependent ribonucleotide reductase [Planctomycetia bacterium]
MEKLEASAAKTPATTANATDNREYSSMPQVGLKIESVFCPKGVASPFDTVEWDVRTASIKGEGGDVVFEQKDCEIPATWSQLATNVVVSKYFYGENGTGERERSVRALVHRVTRTIADWGIGDGYFATAEDGERFYRDLTWLCLHQHASFNSPVWFNVGLYPQYGVQGTSCNWHWDPETDRVVQPENPYEFPQASACFIQSVQDNMEDIMELARSEAMLFKFGSGTGTDLSTLRSHREKLAGGGKPSGPLSFMRVYDQIAAVVKSGGKTRRAAKMQSLKDWHPDILEFIECKCNEEKKALVLIEEGYDPDEAYSSILFQNANLSVRVSDDFMEAVESGKPWRTHWVTDEAREGPTHPAKEMMDRLAQAAWSCGDPGVQYDTTINRWHTCPNSGRINASNPCSEFMFLDDSACNLASMNLMKFRLDDGRFDAERFKQACRLVFIAQDILVDHASYPTKRIAATSHRFRPLGLGYSNLGSLLMAGGLPYDSDDARGLCGAITALLHGSGNLASAELAATVGTFDGYDENREPMLRVMEKHRAKAGEIEHCPAYLKRAATELWDDVVAQGRRHGFRNAQATVLAPTGTISFMMDCDTTGIEPEIALVKYKQLAGGGMLKLVNQMVPPSLRTLGYDEAEIKAICGHIEAEDTIEGAAEIKDEHLPVFDCAFQAPGGSRSIAWMAHIRMMAAAQPFVSGAISKTVNMPKDATVDDVAQAYMEGWRLGLKALAIYRDGSKGAQPVSTKKKKKEEAEKSIAAPRRERLPDTRHSLTHKFNVAGHEGYITVGLYPDGRPGELFITMAKEGSTIGGMMDCFGTAVSMSLQYGVPLEVYVKKFSHTRFEPMGHTKNPDVRFAKSIIDYIFRWLGVTFLPGYREANNGSAPSGFEYGGAGGSEAEPMPAATTVGGQTTGQGPAANTIAANGRTNGSANGSGVKTKASIAVLRPLGGSAEVDAPVATSGRGEQFASFQTDAPSCDNCGAITVRNGNCYLCHNCGNSMGCS